MNPYQQIGQGLVSRRRQQGMGAPPGTLGVGQLPPVQPFSAPPPGMGAPPQQQTIGPPLPGPPREMPPPQQGGIPPEAAAILRQQIQLGQLKQLLMQRARKL